MNVDELLQKFGLKYEDLNSAERETLHTWTEALNKGQLTVEKIREHIHTMRDAVEHELTQTTHGSEQDYLLKARLRNYMLLEAFLTSPEKAKQAMERAVAGIVGRR